MNFIFINYILLNISLFGISSLLNLYYRMYSMNTFPGRSMPSNAFAHAFDGNKCLEITIFVKRGWYDKHLCAKLEFAPFFCFSMNLLLLQNKLKKDPLSYKQDFETQLIHFKSLLEIFKLDLAEENEEIQQVGLFLCHCCQCYSSDFSTVILDFLFIHHHQMAPMTRLKLVQGVLLMNKQKIDSHRIIELCFQLLDLKDKEMRDLVRNYLVRVFKKSLKLKIKAQSMIIKSLNYRTMQICIELYQKNVWNCSKTIQIIQSGLFSDDLKLVKLSCLFFLGKFDTPQEPESEDEVDLTTISFKNQVNRKTKSRSNQYEKALSKLKRKERQKNNVENFNFSALHLVNDPQDLSEKLLQKLRQLTIKNLLPFESRILFMDLISRLIRNLC